MEHARAVFHVCAKKVVKDSLSNARIQATNLFFKHVKGQHMNKTKGASGTYLTEEEYGQVKPIWGCCSLRCDVNIVLTYVCRS